MSSIAINPYSLERLILWQRGRPTHPIPQSSGLPFVGRGCLLLWPGRVPGPLQSIEHFLEWSHLSAAVAREHFDSSISTGPESRSHIYIEGVLS